MKIQTILTTLLVLFTGLLFAQAPQAINYQAVIRDINGNPMLNRAVQLRFTVSGNGGADVFYQETHNTNSDALGGIHLAIGDGSVIMGNFTSIDWKSGDVQIAVEMDPTGGQNFSPFGTTSMASVPYSLYAHQAGSLDDDVSIDPGQLGSGGADIGQVLIWNGSEWTVGDDKDEQTLTVNGNQLSISNGNAVTLPAGQGGGDNWGTQTVETDQTLSGDGTLSSPLELASQGAFNGEVLKWDGFSWTPQSDEGQEYFAGDGISINGNTISNTGDDDNDPDNEIQTLSLNGQVLSLSNGGSVNLPSANYVAGTGINIAGNTISALNTQNLWNANQLQSRGVSNATPASGQVLKFDGSNWSPAADNGQTYTAGTGITITGSTIAAQNTQNLWNANKLQGYNISSSTPIPGQVLTFNPDGNIWSPFFPAETYWNDTGDEIYFMNNVGIGIINPASRLHVAGGGIQIEDETIKKFGTNSLEFSSHIIPLVDNNRSLGLSSRRFTVVWAANGVIQTSDAREKENIQKISYGLDEVMKLNPVSFQWKKDTAGKTKLGFIAQELDKVIPEVILRGSEHASAEVGSASDLLGVYYSDIIPVLVKAIQEQEEKIKQLQAEIEILKQN